MKKILLVSIIVLSTISFAFRATEQATWTLDKSHAKLGFTVTHLLISDVEGWFKDFDAKITSSKDDFSDAIVEMTANVSSINTESEQRDTHLKSPDFFDVAKFSTIIFKSKSFKKEGIYYKVTGDLTMHGVTKTIDLLAICKTGINPMSKKAIAGFKITGNIKRSDFGIGTSMPSTMVSDEVALIANAEFVKN